MKSTALAVVVALTSLAQTPAGTAVRRVLAHPKLAVATAAIERDHDRMVNEIVTLTEIPAPPFKEAARAGAYLAMLRETGLSNVEQDAVGNVMGVRRGTGGGPLIAVAAHLDTVFPDGTDVRVKRNGTRLAAPGIGDATRSLAVLLALIRAMDEAAIRTTSDILFVGDVGEEGPGDLRGVKHLFAAGPYMNRIKMFISIDGAGDGNTITHAGVGSRRYRITFHGPGGHSYSAFGLVNPAFAMAAAIRGLSRIQVPATPKTTFNVGLVGGGTSVNSIPNATWMDVDMRSESAVELRRLEKELFARVRAAVKEENSVRSASQGSIKEEVTLQGDRPAGQTPATSSLVATAAEVVRALGNEPRFISSSTDANLPMSLGIPSIAIESGGEGGQPHALDEWIDVEKTSSVRGIRQALVLLLSLAGMN